MCCQTGNIYLLILVHLSSWNLSEKINLLAGSMPLPEPNSPSLPSGDYSPFTVIEGLSSTTELHLIKLALSRLHRAASFLTPWEPELAAAMRNELLNVMKTRTFSCNEETHRSIISVPPSPNESERDNVPILVSAAWLASAASR